MSVSSLSLLSSSSLLYDSNVLNNGLEQTVSSGHAFPYILGFSVIVLAFAGINSLFVSFSTERLLFLTQSNSIRSVKLPIIKSKKKTYSSVAEDENWFVRFLDEAPLEDKEEIENIIKTKLEAGWYFVSNFDSVLAFTDVLESTPSINQDLATLNTITKINFFFVAALKLSEIFHSTLATWFNPLFMQTAVAPRQILNLLNKPVLIMYDHVSNGYNITFFQTALEANNQASRTLISTFSRARAGLPHYWYISSELFHSLVIDKSIIFNNVDLECFNQFRQSINTCELFSKLNNDIELSQKIVEKVEKCDKYLQKGRVFTYKNLNFVIYKTANKIFMQLV